MKFKLPGWVVDNRTSVLREVADYRDMTPERRLEVLDTLCREGIEMLRGRADREAMLEFRDRLPRSTVAALARLRREATKR